MNDLKKSQDNQNREELKVLARYHSNKDELQRFDVVPSLYLRLCLYTTVCLSVCLCVILGLILCPFFCLSVCLPRLSYFCWCSSSSVHLSDTNRCCCFCCFIFFIYLCLHLHSRRKREENKKHIEQSVKERQKVCWYCIVLLLPIGSVHILEGI